MGLSKHRFGELLELTNEQNTGREYGENDAIGVNVDKIIQPMRGKSLKKTFLNFTSFLPDILLITRGEAGN